MNRPEEQLQRTIADWLRLVRPGVPDLAIVLPEGQAAFIELKAEGRRRLLTPRVAPEHATS